MDIITRTFKVPRGDTELDYVFTTFDTMLKKRQGKCAAHLMMNYLREIFIEGIGDHGPESCSKANQLILHSKKADGCGLKDLARASNYNGKGRNQHDTLQKYFMEHDNYAAATEVPIWDGERRGHADIIRILSKDTIQIAEFKPNAHREKKALTQIYHYRKMLARRLGISKRAIQAFYFDENHCYQLIN